MLLKWTQLIRKLPVNDAAQKLIQVFLLQLDVGKRTGDIALCDCFPG